MAASLSYGFLLGAVTTVVSLPNDDSSQYIGTGRTPFPADGVTAVVAVGSTIGVAAKASSANCKVLSIFRPSLHKSHGLRGKMRTIEYGTIKSGSEK
jgi:hypothetical protein